MIYVRRCGTNNQGNISEPNFSTRQIPQPWTYGLIGGILSLPFTAVSYWQTGSELSLAPVVIVGLVAGYLATLRTGESNGVGLRAGVIGGLPIIWMLIDILLGTSELAGPSWFVTGATLLTILFLIALGVAGFGLSTLVGGFGAKIGSWIAGIRSGSVVS